MTYKSTVKQSVLRPYRKCSIKRRNATDYEASWYDVTSLIKSFGIVTWATDDVKLNKFEQGSITLVARNDTRQWTDEVGNSAALFAGYATPYKTLFKIDIGYYDENDVIWPTNTAVFNGVLVDDITYNSEHEAVLNINPLTWAISEVSASKINPPATTTASNLIAAVRDVDSPTASASYLIRPFITSTSWEIQTTTTAYTDFVSTGLDNYNCWSLMEKLAETENYMVFFGTDGIVHFKDRNPNTTTVDWKFNGPNMVDGEYGTNIIEIDNYTLGWSRIYQRVRIRHHSDDTSTSYSVSEQSYTPGDGSSSWLYVLRTYEFENLWLTGAQASTMAAAIKNDYLSPKREFNIRTKLITTLNLMDRVAISYIGPNSTQKISLWGEAIWGEDVWTGALGGLNLNSVTCKIIRIADDLDNFNSQFVLREI